MSSGEEGEIELFSNKIYRHWTLLSSTQKSCYVADVQIPVVYKCVRDTEWSTWSTSVGSVAQLQCISGE